MVNYPLFARLNAITSFRTEHSELYVVIKLNNEKDRGTLWEGALKDMYEAYNMFF